MIKKYKIQVIVAVLAITAFATTSYATDMTKSENSTAKHKTFKEVEKPSTVNMLEDSWKKGKERLATELRTSNRTKSFSLSNITDWPVIDAGDVDIEFTNTLSEEEASSFNNALYSDSRKNYLQYGDRMPGLLLSPEKDHAFLIWERKNGNIVYFELSSSVDAFGKRTWTNGSTIELSNNR